MEPNQYAAYGQVENLNWLKSQVRGWEAKMREFRRWIIGCVTTFLLALIFATISVPDSTSYIAYWCGAGFSATAAISAGFSYHGAAIEKLRNQMEVRMIEREQSRQQ